MARKLPWLTELKPKRYEQKEELPQPKRRKTRASSDEDDSTDTKRAKGKSRSERNPSSSPPPAPPTPEFMKEGFDQDDMWVMVEDEFLETAKQFTRHLHHAEYQRLKRLTRERKASSADDIVQPVDGKTVMSVAEQKRMEGERLRRQQRKVLRHAAGGREDSEEWEDGAWASNPRLAGLMARSQTTNLAKLIDSQSQTQLPELQPRERPPRVEEPISSPSPDLTSSPPPVFNKANIVSSTRHQAADSTPPKTDSRVKFAERHNHTGSRRPKPKQEEEKRKSVKLDEIPTFLV